MLFLEWIEERRQVIAVGRWYLHYGWGLDFYQLYGRKGDEVMVVALPGLYIEIIFRISFNLYLNDTYEGEILKEILSNIP